MKSITTIVLQTVIVIIGMATVTLLIWLPLTEGRAANLDLLSIYSDPFILYGFATSITFFVGLVQTFKILGYVRLNKVFSSDTVEALKSIKYCAIAFSILIVMAGLYIRIFHNKEDDPAGFIAICIAATFVSMLVATAATLFEKKLAK